MSSFAALLLTSLLAAEPTPRTTQPFKITVVDEATSRGVPLVELRTVHNIACWTDSNGIVAFHEPGLMGQLVFFHVRSHGYEFPKDGFGFCGKALTVSAGGSAVLKVKRLNIAERLYRVTGAGIYRDSLLVGRPVPLGEPVLNGQVAGQDSVIATPYRGQLWWFWGDTMRPNYPLGNYQVTGATSTLPAEGGLDPEAGVELRYFVDDKGIARPMAPVPGDGPTWLGGLVALPDASGRERLLATYAKVRKSLEVYERGVVEYNDDKERFERILSFDRGAPIHPDGHPFRHASGGGEYVYFANPYPLVRMRAAAEAFRRPESFEAFTCLQEGSRLDAPRLDRAADGAPRYRWKRNTPAIGPAEQAKLIQAGLLQPEEALLQLQDAESGKALSAHSGSVYWNAYRKRWVMIAVQSFGTSVLGEIWYTEADTPLGPWLYARKIVTHDRYSFYNPKQHPNFDKDKGRILFFEGTYTHSFSGNPEPTPRYDYNQIMYKLDLADPRLTLPVAFYVLGNTEVPVRFATVRELKPGQERHLAFLALERPVKGTAPVYAAQGGGGSGALKVGEPPLLPDGRKVEPLFHALPADVREPPPTTTPLYEFVHKDGKQRAYTTQRSWSRPDFRRTAAPLCLVWRNPMRLPPPPE